MPTHSDTTTTTPGLVARLRSAAADPVARRAFVVEVARFLLIGIAATVVYVVGVSWGVKVMEWPLVPVNMGFYALSTVVAYLGNYYWTFASGVAHHRATVRYLAMSAVGLLASSAFVAALNGGLGVPLEFATTGFAALWPFASFALQKLFVYS